MKLKHRIWLPPVFVLLIFSIGVAVVTWFSHRTSEGVSSLGSQAVPYLEGARDFSGQFDALVSAVQSAVAEGDQARLEEVAQRAQSLRQLLESLQPLAPQGSGLGALREHFDRYAEAALDAAKVMLGTRSGDRAQAVQRMQEAYKVMVDAKAALRRDAEARMEEGILAARHGIDRSLMAMVLSAIGACAVMLASSWMLANTIWREIGGEPAYARCVLERIARGDLSQDVIVAGGRESLLGAMHQMADGLASIVTTVREGSDAMASASRQIAAGNEDLSHRTEQTASNLQGTAASVTQLTSQLQQAAASARTASQLAVSAADAAHRGGDVISQVMSTMNEIRESSRRIGEIIGTINRIAFQTNILALNAAVEAARAGEHGRGFAVVAGEVRSLSHRAAEAAHAIKGLIGSSVERVEAGSKLVTDAGETMQEIVNAAKHVSDVVVEVAQSVVHQAGALGEVDQAVGQLDQMTQQNAALVEQASAAAASLSQQALRLTDRVSMFRLPGAIAGVA